MGLSDKEVKSKEAEELERILAKKEKSEQLGSESKRERERNKDQQQTGQFEANNRSRRDIAEQGRANRNKGEVVRELKQKDDQSNCVSMHAKTAMSNKGQD